MDEGEMGEIASIIGDILKHPEDAGTKAKSGQRVRDLMERFPAYA
jgi:glycine/serine hydroxymethyltransferase